MSRYSLYFRRARCTVVVPALFVLVAAATQTFAQGTLEDDLRRATVRVGASDRPQSEADSIAAEGATAFRAGKTDAALELYDQAAGIAYKSGAKGSAFEYALVAAEIQRSRGEWIEAGERFRRAALSSVNDPRASQAHLVACQAMGEALRAGNQSDELVESYDQFLAEHIETWPRSPSAAELEWLRIELLIARNGWTQLADVARTVPTDHPRYARALELLVTAHARLLDESSPENYDERLNNASADLQPIVLGERGLWPTEWSPLQRSCALTLARGHLLRTEGGADYTRRLLQVALLGMPQAEPAWSREAISLLVIAELALGDVARADHWLQSELTSPPEARVKMLGAIRERLEQSSIGQRHVEADRLFQHLDALVVDNGTTSPSTRARAAALAESGQHAEALKIYEALLAEEPNNRELLVAQARQLEALSTREGLIQALAAWRTIEARSERSTEAWYEARLERLRLLISTGNKEEARKLLKLTKLTAPKNIDPQMKTRIEAIGNALK